MKYRAIDTRTNHVTSEMDDQSPHFDAWVEIVRGDPRVVILKEGQTRNELCRKLEGTYGRIAMQFQEPAKG